MQDAHDAEGPHWVQVLARGTLGLERALGEYGDEPGLDLHRRLERPERAWDVASLTITEHVGGDASARRIAALIAALHHAGW
jgi:hypothetical protein